jgi:hypothetical protein
VFLLLLACTDSPEPPSTTPDDTASTPIVDDTGGDSGTEPTGDSGQETAWDGTTAADNIVAVVVEEIVTVIRVTWTTEVETHGRVRFGDSVALGRQTDATDWGTEHEVLLLGMPEQTEVVFQVVSEDSEGAETWLAGTQAISTGTLPDYLPVFESTGQAPSWDDVLVGPLTSSVTYALMIDNQGRIIWYDALPAGGQLMRTTLSHDRREMLYFIAGPRGDLDSGGVTRVSLDLSESTQLPTPGVDHDMIELPQGGYAAIVPVEAADPDSAPENSLADAIVEFDTTGNATEIWNAWDVFAEHANPNTNWTHANALDYDPVTDTYTVSLKDFNALVHIDAETGETLWVLGGEADQFTYAEGTEKIPHHHQFELLGDSIVIFDNGDSSGGYSRAVELTLDLDTMTAEEVWSFRHTPDYLVTAKGDVARFADGNTQIVWSSNGEVQDVTPDGEVVWQLNTDSANFVFTEHHELYRGD